ncbi:hypothetical protein ATCC90586_005433 [Pythium insidiosum]|nr:hypothetical protein ATCC90586_005433 [Pythium insidiosum]
MPRFASIFAAALAVASLACQGSQAFWIFNEDDVQDRPVNGYNSAVLTTALKDPHAIAPEAGSAICPKKVNRVREGKKDNDLFFFIFNVDGCKVDPVTGLCSADCEAVPHQVIISSVNEPVRHGEESMQTSFKVESITQL